MMEKEYINREEIVELAARLKPRFAPLHRLVLEAFVYAMKDIPSADVAPVVHGEWIFKEYSEDTYTNLTRIYECSICGRTIECLNKADEPYCHCGAKMFKEAE